MSQKVGRSGGEVQGACSLGAPLPQGVLAGGFVGTVGRAATRATVASEPVEHEKREPRAGCKRLPVVVYIGGNREILVRAHSSVARDRRYDRRDFGQRSEPCLSVPLPK